MRWIFLLLLVLLAPQPALAESVTVGGKTFTPDMSLVWTPKDPELQQLADRYKENFDKNEQRYRQQLALKRQRIIDDPNLLAEQKAVRLKRAEAWYTKSSTRNVAQFREPLLERMKQVANNGLSTAGGIKDTAGEGLYLKETDPRVIAHRKAGGKGRLYNPAYGGALSDKDMGGSSLASNRFGKVVQHYFGESVETANGEKIPTLSKSTHTVEAKFLEATVNVTPEVYDQKTGKFENPDPAGSSSREAKYRSMAGNEEVYLSVSAEGNPGAKQMMAFDHFAKGIEAAHIPAAEHVNPGRLGEVRPLYKATHKMVGELDKSEFNAIKAKTGYQGDFDAFKSQVRDLKLKASMDAVGINADNIAAFKATTEAVQDLALEKSKTQWKGVQSSEVDEIRKAQAEVPGLKGAAREAKLAEIQQRKTALIDSRARMNALEAMAEDARNGVTQSPEKVTPIPGRKTARAKINKKLEGWMETASPKLGVVMNGYEKVTWALRVGSSLSNEGVAGAAKEVGAIAWEEAKDRAYMTVANRIIPGYGNLKMAYDVGFGAGRLIGEHVKLYPDGPTVDEAAQNFFEKVYDAASGNRENRWENERLQDYHRFMSEMIDNWGAELPPGMTRGQAMAYAIEQDNKGGNFHQAMEKLFEAGDKAKDMQKTEHRELSDAVKQAALADAAASKAKEESDRAAALVNTTPPPAVSGLQALLAKKKAESQRDPASDGGDGMKQVFDKGTETIGKYRELERATEELKQARRHLAEVRARIAAREREREAENRAFAQSLSGFGQALSQAAQAYSQQYQQYQRQRPAASSASSRASIGSTWGGRDMSKPAWVSQTSSASTSSTSAQSSKKSCSKFQIDGSPCKSAYVSCMKGCPTSGSRATIQACHMRCGNVSDSCKRSQCPGGSISGSGWNITCSVCR